MTSRRISLVALIVAACLPHSATAQVRGAAVTSRGTILTWGTELLEWRGTEPTPLLTGTGFGEGGCVSGHWLFVASQPGLAPLVRIDVQNPQRREVVEPETDFSDCLWTTLFGQSGLVVIHRHTQVRFYQPPPQHGGAWPYRELYSIYTASTQGGLLQHDVDQDGYPDFFVGNYWMKSPARPELPWRIFAINLYHETPRAALGRLALYRGTDLVWAERTGRRVTRFERPPRLVDQWIPHDLQLGVAEPNGVVADDESIIVGGRDRIVAWRNSATETLASGFRTLQLFRVNRRLWAVTPDGVREVVYPRK